MFPGPVARMLPRIMMGALALIFIVAAVDGEMHPSCSQVVGRTVSKVTGIRRDHYPFELLPIEEATNRFNGFVGAVATASIRSQFATPEFQALGIQWDANTELEVQAYLPEPICWGDDISYKKQEGFAYYVSIRLPPGTRLLE